MTRLSTLILVSSMFLATVPGAGSRATAESIRFESGKVVFDGAVAIKDGDLVGWYWWYYRARGTGRKLAEGQGEVNFGPHTSSSENSQRQNGVEVKVIRQRNGDDLKLKLAARINIPDLGRTGWVKASLAVGDDEFPKVHRPDQPHSEVKGIFSKKSGLLLDAASEDLAKTSGRVQLWKDWGKTQLNQSWCIESAGGGYVYIINKANGKALDAKDQCINDDGCAVQMFSKAS